MKIFGKLIGAAAVAALIGMSASAKAEDDVKFTHKEINTLPATVRKEVRMFCYYDEKYVHIPRVGLNAANLSIYLNHSKTPNLQLIAPGQFETLRVINEGEELFMDYDITFGETHIFE